MTKAIRKLLELPEKWLANSEQNRIASNVTGSATLWDLHIKEKRCANQLQSALEAADLQGLVGRVDAAELAVKECHLQEDEVTLIYELAQMRKRVEGLEKLSIYLYNSGYHAGHEDTVEGGYTDVYPEDMHTYHDDLVAELIQEHNDE